MIPTQRFSNFDFGRLVTTRAEVGAHGAAISLISQNQRNFFRWHVSSDASMPVIQYSTRNSNYFCERIFELGCPVIVTDTVTTNLEFGPQKEENTRVRSYLGCPIYESGAKRGAAELYSQGPRRWSGQDLQEIHKLVIKIEASSLLKQHPRANVENRI